MRICLMIEGQENVSWDEWLALAATCEELGYDALFRSDHYQSFGHPAEWSSLDAWATIASISQRTDRLRFGTLVSPVTFRHPSELAKSVATVDHASGGRVELGLGAGWHEGEHRAYGFPFPPTAERMEMLAEQAEIVHRLWDRDEDAVTFEGRHYRLDDCHALPKPLTEPHPPLIVGGSAGRRSCAIAARWADEYNQHFVGPEECRRSRERLDAACEAAGRDPATLPMSLMIGSLFGADDDDLISRAGRLMERRGGGGDARAYLEGLGDGYVTGTPEQVLEQLAAFADAGVTRIMFQHLLHRELEPVDLIGREVIQQAASL